jgi:predicted nuclease of predicted toxin-antitoxin system
MALKFYFDTHIAKQVALQLRNKGVDVVRCEEVSMAEASDLEHLEYAVKEDRVLVSMDEDFHQLHIQWLAEDKHHTGIFWILQRVGRGKTALGIMVKELSEYHQLVEQGAGSVERDFHNQIFYIG